MSTIKEAVLALADTNPELSRKLAKEAAESTTVSASFDNNRKYMQQVSLAIKSLNSSVKEVKNTEYYFAIDDFREALTSLSQASLDMGTYDVSKKLKAAARSLDDWQKEHWDF